MSGSSGSPEPATGDVAASKPKRSGSGRNLPAAVAVGVVLVAIVLASLYLQLWIFMVVIVAAIVIGTAELADALRVKDIRLTRTPLLVSAVLLPALAWFWGPDHLLMGYGLMFLVLLVWRLLRYGVDDFVRDSTASAFILSYAPLMGGFAALIAASPDGADRVLTFIVLSFVSDIGGFATGVKFGKHPMAPGISPKKSWEGFTGSLVCGIAAAILAVTFLLDKPAWVGVPLGVFLVVTGTLGDLVESQVKRDLGIKDMGTLLPGHGGLMDRIDAILAAAPATWIVLTLLA